MLTAHKNLHDYIAPFFKKIVELGGTAATGKGVGVSLVTPIATFKTAVAKTASDIRRRFLPHASAPTPFTTRVVKCCGAGPPDRAGRPRPAFQ